MWLSVCLKLSHVFVSDSTCTMVASDIIHSDDNRLPLANVVIDLNACKQKCLNMVACTAIIHYVPNACVLFSQYINGSSSETSFIKSCSQKLCELFPIQLPVSIILTVCTDNCHLAVSVSVSFSLYLSLCVFMSILALFLSVSHLFVFKMYLIICFCLYVYSCVLVILSLFVFSILANFQGLHPLLQICSLLAC